MSTWKNVGMTYLKYADLCATHLRNALKEPAKSKAMTRSDMHARIMVWEDGKRGKPGTHPPRPSLPPPDSCREGGHRLGKGHLSSGICMHGALFPGGGGGEVGGSDASLREGTLAHLGMPRGLYSRVHRV